MNVKSFTIEESKVNKGALILIATTDDDKKYVVGGDNDYPARLVLYENSWDGLGKDEYKKLTGY